MSEPTTAAGRALLKYGDPEFADTDLAQVLAIEAEARAAALDEVEEALERVHRERHRGHPGIRVCQYKACTIREPWSAIDALRERSGE